MTIHPDLLAPLAVLVLTVGLLVRVRALESLHAVRYTMDSAAQEDRDLGTCAIWTGLVFLLAWGVFAALP